MDLAPFLSMVAEWTIDAWTVLVGLVCVFSRWVMQGRSILKDECVVSFLNGATMVPFFVLAISAFSPGMLQLAMTTKGSMALAGCVGIFFVLGETIAPKDLRKKAVAAATDAEPGAAP